MGTFTQRRPVPSRTGRTGSPTSWASAEGRRRARGLAPLLERLEDRTVLSPTVYTVTFWGDSSGDPHTSTSGDLRYCIGLANANTANPDGSLIQFNSLFNVARTITLGNGLTLSNEAAPTTITGPGTSLLTVLGGGSSSNFSVFTVKSGVTLTISELTIANGNTFYLGGGVLNNGIATLANDTLSGNSAVNGGSGGGLYNTGTVTLTSDTFSGNTSSFGEGGGVLNAGTATLTSDTFFNDSAFYTGGGVYNFGTMTVSNTSLSQNEGDGVCNDGTATLTNDTLSGNSATGTDSAGGGFCNDGTATLTNDTLSGNSAEGTNIYGDPYSYGGGVFNNTGCTVTMTNVTLSGNSATDGGTATDGGGVYNNGLANLNNVTLSENSAGSGGGIYNYSSTVTMTNVTLSGNSATDNGGGIYNYSGTATLTDDILSGNSATGIYHNGGGVYNLGTATLTDTTLSGNSATDGGGVCNNTGGTATLTNVTLSGNSVTDHGGGVYNNGTATLTNTTLSGNSAVAGGGVYNVSTATLTSTTLSGNSATDGGGVCNDGSGMATLTNDTLCGNSATYEGGGVYNDGDAWATLTNDTLCGNSATYEGGGISSPGATTLTNTIVANSTSGGAISGVVIGSYNLIDDASSAGGLVNGSNGNLVGINPMLASLGNYGGLTQTIAILPGSPAIDSGNTSLAIDGQGHSLTTDQRGFPRVVGTSVDIGAFETSGFTLAVTAGNNQSTVVATMFPTALQVTITPNNAGDPVDGGTISYTAPPTSGVSATLTPANPVTIAGGSATVNATANPTIGGSYTITASTSGVATPASFSLTNSAPLVTSLSIVPSISSPSYGQSLTFTVTAAPGGAGAPTPTGTVQFEADGIDLGAPVTLAARAATSIGTSGLSAGSHTITALYSGDAYYLANSASIPLVVTKAHLTVTADAKSMLYGGSVPALTATISGFVDGDTSIVVSGTPGLSTSATSASPVSTYTISVTEGSLSAANYDFSNLVNGTLTINKAHLTVTAATKSMVYGGSVPALTATISGFLNGDTSSVVSGTPGLSTSASSAGSYTITVTVGSLSAANYDFPNLVNGTLTINKAHLTVTANVKSMVYGGSVPALTATISGFVNGDTSSVVSGTPGLSTPASSASSAGSYTITVTAGSLLAANYDFPNLVNGTLTINKAHLTVTADTKSMVYGGSVPALAASISGFVNGDTSSAVSGSPGLSTSASSASPVDSYTITVAAGTLSAANYDFPNLVNGTLTVNKAQLIVTADTKSMLYGGSVPALTATISGFLNGDTSSAVSGSPGLSTSASSASPVDSYTITVAAGTLSAANYDFPNLVNGTLTVNKAHLTVTVDTKSMLYGGSVPALTATFSGLVNGDTSNVVNGAPGLSTSASSASPVGTYTITVTAGNLSAANYDFPNLVNGTLTVNKAHLTVTADAKSMVYGGSVPTLTATISGFVNGDLLAVVSGVATLSTAVTTTSPAGNYPVAVAASTLSATNYDFPNLVNGTLTVNKAHLTVTADAKSMLYGGSVPALTATISGFVNGDTSSVVSGTPGLRTSATSSSPAATYTIAVTAGSLWTVNYTFILVSGTLSVTPVPLTITANGATKIYGAGLPALLASYSGFVNGDSSASLTALPTLSTTATASSPVQPGGYAIIASGASDSDYTISYRPGALLVTPAPLTITANNASMFLGSAVPPLSVSYSGFMNGDSAVSLNRQPTVTTPATPLSPAGDYPIVPAGASSPNYTLKFANGVLVVTPAPVRVLNVSIQAVRLGKTKKTSQVIMLHFSGALNAGDAQSLSNYSIVTIPSNKKQKSNVVALSQATYNLANSTVRLVTRRPLVLNAPLRLTLYAAGLLDSLGHPLDGNHDGQPGGNCVVTLRKSGATIA